MHNCKLGNVKQVAQRQKNRKLHKARHLGSPWIQPKTTHWTSQSMWFSDLMPPEHLSLASIYISTERWITCFLEASSSSSCFLHPFELYITYFIMFWGTYFSFVLKGKIQTTVQEREQHRQLELPSSFCAWCSCICNESFARCFQTLKDDSRKEKKKREMRLCRVYA